MEELLKVLPQIILGTYVLLKPHLDKLATIEKKEEEKTNIKELKTEINELEKRLLSVEQNVSFIKGKLS